MAQIKQILLGSLLSLLVASLGVQFWQTWRFKQQGARFTAQDGQALCERVRALEQASIGFQQAGKVSPPCQFQPTAPH